MKEQIDEMVFQAVFSSNQDKQKAREEIRKLAKKQEIYPASLHNFYLAQGREFRGFTVPAINIRFLTYDTARIVFRLVQKLKVGPFIFEIAKSEQKYTDQTPDEYATTILAAAVAEDYQGPVFLQGDHYQFNALSYHSNPKSEIDGLERLIRETGKYSAELKTF